MTDTANTTNTPVPSVHPLVAALLTLIPRTSESWCNDSSAVGIARLRDSLQKIESRFGQTPNMNGILENVSRAFRPLLPNAHAFNGGAPVTAPLPSPDVAVQLIHLWRAYPITCPLRDVMRLQVLRWIAPLKTATSDSPQGEARALVLQWMSETAPKSNNTASTTSNSNTTSSSNASTSAVPRRRSFSTPAGLTNMVNSCYLNSVLQCLYFTDVFRRDLLRLDRLQFYVFLKEHSALLHLQTIFAFLNSTQRESYAPRLFAQSLPVQFQEATQQDAGEFAKFVLDAAGAGMNAFKALMKERRARIRGELPAKSLPSNTATPQQKSQEGINGGNTEAAANDVVMTDANASTTAAPASSSTPPPNNSSSSTIIDLSPDEYFGGNLLSTIRCGTCGTCSSKVEAFNELPVALEIEETEKKENLSKEEKTSSSMQPAAVASSPATNEPLAPIASSDSSTTTVGPTVSALPSPSTDDDVDMSDASSTTSMEVVASNSSASAPSTASPEQNAAMASASIVLAAMAAQSVAAQNMSVLAAAVASNLVANKRAPLPLSALLSHYFSAETLEGANAYFCSKCQTKRQSTKQLRLLNPSPPHLMICLKRNKFEFINGQLIRSKIMREIQFPCVLKIPVLAASESDINPSSSSDSTARESSSSSSSATSSSFDPSTSKQLYKTYVLYAAIVHSGLSSQQGHYYSICRHSDEEALAELASVAAEQSESSIIDTAMASDQVDPALEKRAQQGPWYCLNDSVVTRSSFDELAKISDSRPTDVAYLLMYRSLDSLPAVVKQLKEAAATQSAASASSQNASVSHPYQSDRTFELNPTLLQMVQQDNVKFVAEQAADQLASRTFTLPKVQAPPMPDDGYDADMM